MDVWSTTAATTTRDHSMASMVAMMADMEWKYRHFPVAVRASKGALDAIRAMADEVREDAGRRGHPESPILPQGLPIYFDESLKPGTWRLVRSRDELQSWLREVS